MPTPINTAKVTGRRPLHFHSFDDIGADVECLAKAREVRTLGNWTAGQILKHLAIVMNKSIDGFVNRPPWIIRWIARLFFKKRFLTKPMSAGFKLPARAQAELVPAPCGLEEGLQSIREALGRQRTEKTRVPNVVLGPLTLEEWTQLHCRHAELHLSFMAPVE